MSSASCIHIAYHECVRKNWLIITIFILGFFLRSLDIGTYPLRFDQVQILENVDRIRGGHLTLIGPRTGPAEMFTGPLIYYIATLVSFVVPYPYAAVGMSLLLYSVSFEVLWVILKRYFGKSFVSLYLGLFALSTLIAVLDRTPWNPNLSFLSGALVFFPLLKLFRERKTDIIDELFLASGIFLGYQAHFSGLLLPVIALLAWLLWSRHWRFIGVVIGGTVVTLLPTLIFDLKYQWLNLRGLIALFQNKDQATTLISLFERLGHDLSTILFNQGRIFIFSIPLLQQALLGLIIFATYFFFVKKRQANIFPFVWLSFFLISFMFYAGTKPEYYFLMAFPAFVYMGTKIMKELVTEKLIIVWLGIFTVFSLGGLLPEVRSFSGLTIGDQLKAEKYVRSLLVDDPNQMIVYDISTADQVGMKYLLQDLTPVSESNKKIHFIFPGTDQVPATERFGTMAVWVDPRVRSDLSYVQIRQLSIAHPKSVKLLINPYPRQQFVAAENTLDIFSDNIFVGTLYQFDDQIEKDFTLKTFIKSIAGQWNEEKSGWQRISVEKRTVWVEKVPHKIFIADLSTSDMNEEQQLQFLNKFEIISPL